MEGEWKEGRKKRGKEKGGREEEDLKLTLHHKKLEKRKKLNPKLSEEENNKAQSRNK